MAEELHRHGVNKFHRFGLVIALVALASSTAVPRGRTQKQKQDNYASGERILWRDPQDVASLDFQYGIGGRERQPQPPFHFVSEDLSGHTAKINVTDARGAHWNLKWGHEVLPSTFCTRLAWACGYVAEPEYFVQQGHIEGAHRLTRARSRVSRDGSFQNARFQLRSEVPRYLKDYGWRWDDNPFLGTHELQGLKILTLLVSNADAKNVNLGVLQDDSSGTPRYLYATTDWGWSLGKWGNVITRNVRDCDAFAEQTAQFVKGVDSGRLTWRFKGIHSALLTDDITVGDVKWLLQYLGKITDEQLRVGLSASGATPQETECYAQALRQRIEQLQKAAEQPAGPSVPAPVTMKR
jgi:hypothetical protein